MLGKWIIIFFALLASNHLPSCAQTQLIEPESSNKFDFESALPDGPLIAGYAPGCDEKVTNSVMEGINLLYWFQISLSFNASNQSAYISYGGPSLDCIVNVTNYLKNEKNLNFVSFITIGGWDAPHPNEQLIQAGPLKAFEAFHEWNQFIYQKYNQTFFFQGIDWDLEGNDDVNSDENFFSIDLLDFMGEFSQLAKSRGYLVSMVPAESYLDPTTSLFDQSLLHTYPDGWQPSFNYHGHNTYAYLLARFGESTFDLILIQLYESYSHLSYNVSQTGQTPADYLTNWIPLVSGGWTVDFDGDKNISNPLPSNFIQIPPQKLLVGFGGSWVGGSPKNVLVLPSQISEAHANLEKLNMQPRGYFVWCIEDEGGIPSGSTEKLYFFKELNQFLHVRN